jgi:hypothetical protein
VEPGFFSTFSKQGAHAALTNVDELAFGSRMRRANNNSGTPIRITEWSCPRLRAIRRASVRDVIKS